MSKDLDFRGAGFTAADAPVQSVNGQDGDVVLDSDDLADKNDPNGFAGLDNNGKILSSQLPPGPFIDRGNWNATTNSPTLADGSGTAGDWYNVSVAGTRDLGSGSIDFGVNDALHYDGSVWQKIDNTDLVTSVQGHQGVITLVQKEIFDTAATITANTSGTFNINLATANIFNVTVSDPAVVLDIINCPNTVYTFKMQLSSTAIFTFASANVQAMGGNSGLSFASLTSSGPMLMDFYTFDGGANWLYTAAQFPPLSHAARHRSGGADALLSNTTTLGTSNLVAPSQNAVKTYVDTQIAAIPGATTEQIQDIVGAEIVSGTNITATYNDGAGTVTVDSNVTDATLPTTDVTTNDVSTTKHGFAPKAPNNAGVYLDGTGNYSTPSGTSGNGTISSDYAEMTASGTKTTTAVADIPNLASVVVDATAGDKLEIILWANIGANSSSNGVATYVKIASGSDLRVAKVLVDASSAVAPTTQNAIGIMQYVVQSGDVSGGTVTIVGRWGCDNTNSVGMTGGSRSGSVAPASLSVKNLGKVVIP